jgi:hypothetical protein
MVKLVDMQNLGSGAHPHFKIRKIVINKRFYGFYYYFMKFCRKNFKKAVKRSFVYNFFESQIFINDYFW